MTKNMNSQFTEHAKKHPASSLLEKKRKWKQQRGTTFHQLVWQREKQRQVKRWQIHCVGTAVGKQAIPRSTGGAARGSFLDPQH